ncbi:MAG TPA: hypothetical protein VFX60_13020 [Micromonospora sp.]|nr:hypothetical protein [Micromonospora sp.]
MVSRAEQAETDALAALVRDVQRLKRELRELRAARRLESATIGQGGITIKDGGSLRIVDEDGNVIARFGDLSEFGDGMKGVILQRAGGEQAFSFYGTGVGDEGFVGIYDRSGNYIVTDDAHSRRGLARPYIPLHVGEIVQPVATTTSGSFTDVLTGANVIQHPVLYAHLLVQAGDASTAGQVRLALDGAAIGPTLTVSAGSYTFASIGPFAVPSPGPYAALRTLSVQARRSAGASTIGVRVMSLLGLESAYA